MSEETKKILTLRSEKFGERSLRLCNKCCNLHPELKERVLFEQLLEGSDEGCRTCRFFCEIVDSCVREDERKAHDEYFEPIECFADGPPPYTTSGLCVTFWGSEMVEIDLDLTDRESVPRSPPFVGSSKESIKTAQSWLQNCAGPSSDHDKCRNQDLLQHPTRLLELSGTEANITVRLRHRDEHISQLSNDSLKYVALSHCWGPPGSRRLTTTRENLETRKDGISWGDIPRTFQDAITFTFRLGVRYIWIDSLCIIQDDPNDWRMEASQMANVYSGSYVTLVATNAQDPGAGLFQEPPLDFKARPFMNMTPEGDNESVELILYAKRRLVYFEIDTLKRYPLMSRAWTYQERFLSPRAIYFLQGEIAWRCHSCTDDERDIYTFKFFEFGQSEAKRLLFEITKSEELQSQTRVVMGWHHIVQEYSLLALSAEKDKLPALAGIANSMKPYRKGKYYVGLWEDSLHVDLTWFNINPEKVSRPHTKRAPTWTWASLDCTVNFFLGGNFGRVEEVATIISVSCHYLGPDTAGEVSGGELKISGPLIQGPPYGRDICPSSETLYFDHIKEACADEAVEAMTSFYYLSLCNLSYDVGTWEEKVYLVLRPTGEDGSVFERVGLAKHTHDGKLEFDEQTVQTITII